MQMLIPVECFLTNKEETSQLSANKQRTTSSTATLIIGSFYSLQQNAQMDTPSTTRILVNNPFGPINARTRKL